MAKTNSIIILIALVLLVISGIAPAEKNFSVGVEAGYFAPSDEDISDIYGGKFVLGANLAYLLSSNFRLQIAGDIYSAEGTTAITEQTVELDMVKLRLGGFYVFDLGDVNPRAGAGIAYCSVDESAAFDEFSDSGFGWFIAAGADMKISDSLSAGLEILYSDVNIEGNFGDQSTGGLSVHIIIAILL